MEHKAEGSLIRLFIAMNAIARPLIAAFHLPRWSAPLPFSAARRRRQATLDLIHSSPHLLRDIGVSEGNDGRRQR